MWAQMTNAERDSWEYLEKHQLLPFFQELFTQLLISKPENPIEYVRNTLVELKRARSRRILESEEHNVELRRRMYEIDLVYSMMVKLPQNPRVFLIEEFRTLAERSQNPQAAGDDSDRMHEIAFRRRVREIIEQSMTPRGSPGSERPPSVPPFLASACATPVIPAMPPAVAVPLSPSPFAPFTHEVAPRSPCAGRADLSQLSQSSALRQQPSATGVEWGHALGLFFSLSAAAAGPADHCGCAGVPPRQPGPRVRETDTVRVGEDIGGHKVVNQYVLYNTLGMGSTGKVKYAIDAQTGKPCCIKIAKKAMLKRPSIASSDQLMDVRYTIALMKRLRHPNIVQLLEVMDDPTQDCFYMVMEHMKKGSIMQLRAGESVEPLDPEFMWSAFRDIVAGLEYPAVHENKVVHRDIKPENLLVDADNTVKIADFSESQIFVGDDAELVRTAGSPAFLAPEVMSTRETFGKGIDIWAIGVSLYCFKYGHVPFWGRSIGHLFNVIANSPHVSPCLEPIDPALRDLIERLLEKDPKKRIAIAEIKAHAWVTRGGRYPMAQLEASQSPRYSAEKVSDEELQRAVVNINHLTTLIKVNQLVNKFIQRRKQARAATVKFTEGPSCVPPYKPQLAIPPHLRSESGRF
eukprot:m51a1_g7478 putative calcium calmodulin dependent protein kinase (633) ;mRNA; r:205840-208565